MKSTYYLVLFLVVITNLAAGCIAPTFSIPSPPSLALHLSDLPDNFNITGYSNLTRINDSWKNDYLGGYYIQFAPVITDGNITGISQTILSFKTNNVSGVYSVSLNSLQFITDRNVSRLATPAIGDRSDAYRITDTTGNWNPVDYVILFTKNGIIEQVEIYGPNPDYTLAKNLAEKAAQKIK